MPGNQEKVSEGAEWTLLFIMVNEGKPLSVAIEEMGLKESPAKAKALIAKAKDLNPKAFSGTRRRRKDI